MFHKCRTQILFSFCNNANFLIQRKQPQTKSWLLAVVFPLCFSCAQQKNLARFLLRRTFSSLTGCVHLSFPGGVLAEEVDDSFQQDYSFLRFHGSFPKSSGFFPPCFKKEHDQMMSLGLSSYFSRCSTLGNFRQAPLSKPQILQLLR